MKHGLPGVPELRFLNMLNRRIINNSWSQKRSSKGISAVTQQLLLLVVVSSWVSVLARCTFTRWVGREANARLSAKTNCFGPMKEKEKMNWSASCLSLCHVSCCGRAKIKKTLQAWSSRCSEWQWQHLQLPHAAFQPPACTLCVCGVELRGTSGEQTQFGVNQGKSSGITAVS